MFTREVNKDGITVGKVSETAVELSAPIIAGKVAAPVKVSQTFEELGGLPDFRVRQSKWDYFFDRGIKPDVHNIPRTAQNKINLEQLGIFDNAQGTDKMLNIFEQGLKLPAKSVHKSQYGITVTKHVQVSEAGGIDIKYFYPKGNMSAKPQITTMIPKVYK